MILHIFGGAIYDEKVCFLFLFWKYMMKNFSYKNALNFETADNSLEVLCIW